MFCRSLDGFHQLNGNISSNGFPEKTPQPRLFQRHHPAPALGQPEARICCWTSDYVGGPNVYVYKNQIEWWQNHLSCQIKIAQLYPLCEFGWQSWYQMGPFQWLERQINHLAPQLIHHPAARHGDRCPQLNPAIGGPGQGMHHSFRRRITLIPKCSIFCGNIYQNHFLLGGFNPFEKY